MAIPNIIIENARIGFRNFSGKEGKFNPAGVRNFCLFLDDDRAQQLKEEGWNIRWLRPVDAEEEPQGYLQVTVNYKKKPPKIILISSAGKTQLDEDSVNILDWADIKTVDLTINPSMWEANGKSGIKAYIKYMYVTIAEDDFEKKYMDHPANAIDSIGGCGNCETCDGTCKGHK